ncbi:immunity 21 family protein [Streptomyces sp. NPDC008313]|uniref:immunity 21 family protein n=1 Tax=Streptomyces sp. NPDC008313 TaxID=3364826 RepID=UPI0036E4E527
MVRYEDPGAVEWVESGGGPLIVVPEVVLPFWSGADGDEMSSDYDRACDVDGAVGLVPVGDTRALVLGDEPAATAYLPEHGVFVRWSAADSEAGLLACVPAALHSADWGPQAHWDVPGDVLLFDAAHTGPDAERAEDHVRVALAPGRYAVRAASARPAPGTSLHLVRLRPAAR